jgi:ArsR family transcriptional regulator
MPPYQSPLDFVTTLAEPTRLRILNCLAAAPLFVSDIQAVLDLPQPTVSRHLRVLRTIGVVRDTPIAQFVLYRLRREENARGRLVRVMLETMNADEQLKTERLRAVERSRAHSVERTRSPAPALP